MSPALPALVIVIQMHHGLPIIIFGMLNWDALLQCSLAAERSAGWAEKHAAENQRLVAQHASAQAEFQDLSGSLRTLSASLEGWISESASSKKRSAEHSTRHTTQADSEAATADHEDSDLEERRSSNAAASTSADAEGLQALNVQISELKTDMTSTAAEIKAEEERLQALQRDLSVAKGAIKVAGWPSLLACCHNAQVGHPFSHCMSAFNFPIAYMKG